MVDDDVGAIIVANVRCVILLAIIVCNNTVSAAALLYVQQKSSSHPPAEVEQLVIQPVWVKTFDVGLSSSRYFCEPCSDYSDCC